MKKILIISTWLPGGGVETVINNFHNQTKEDIDLSVVVLSEMEKWNWKNPDLVIRRYDVFHSDSIGMPEAYKKRFVIKGILSNEVAEIEPDIIMFTSTILGLFLRRFRKTSKLIFWPHHPFFTGNLKPCIHFLKERYLKFLISRADISFAISPFIQNELEGANLNSFLTFNPIENTKFSINKKPQKKRFLFIGKLEPRKNLAYLLDELQMLDEEWEIDIIGDGELMEALKNRYPQYPNNSKVNWLGFQNKPFSRKLNYSALISSSLSEGLPMVITDALLHGIPVIVPKHLCFGNEIIFEAENGGEYDMEKEGDLARVLKVMPQYDSPKEISEKQTKRFGKSAFLKRFYEALNQIGYD